MVKLIVAVGPNNLIGKGNKLPWHIPSEFKFFKDMTMNDWLLMGRNTFEGIQPPLKGRKMCIASRKNVENADKMVHNTEEILGFINSFKDSEEILWIAGGKKIYEDFYLLAQEIYISEVITDKTGDVYLNLDLSMYNKEVYKEDKNFIVYKYTKK